MTQEKLLPVRELCLQSEALQKKTVAAFLFGSITTRVAGQK